MNYKMNLGAWNSIFAVPCSVVDEHIKLAGAAQLKVLLWFLRHAGENFCDEDMASALSMSPADARDSMQYWIATGIITIDKESGSIIPSVNETSAPFGFKLTEKPTFTAKIEPKAETLKAEITPVEQPIEKKQSEPKNHSPDRKSPIQHTSQKEWLLTRQSHFLCKRQIIFLAE